MASLAAIGSVIGGLATAASAVMQASVASMNASVERDNANRAIQYAQMDAQESDLQARAALGEQIAAQSASGVAVETGSTKSVRQVARRLARLDALNIKQEGELKAYNHRVAAASYQAQAGVSMVQGIGGALGSFLSAGSQISNSKPVARRNYYPPAPTPRGVLY